jgi:hypothetical protein
LVLERLQRQSRPPREHSRQMPVYLVQLELQPEPAAQAPE